MSQGSATGTASAAAAHWQTTNPVSKQHKHRAARQATTYAPKQRSPSHTAAWVRLHCYGRGLVSMETFGALLRKYSCGGSQRICYTYYTNVYSYSQRMDAPVRLGTYLTPLDR
jgi:hypothetical protein